MGKTETDKPNNLLSSALVTIEELDKKLNAFIANSDETKGASMNKAYEEFKKAIPSGTPGVTVKATETGVDGNKIFKIVKITGGTDPQKAIDGKKSTYSEGKVLTADIGGIGLIRTIALKLVGGPYTFEFQFSIDNKTYVPATLGSVTSNVKTGTDFAYFVLPREAPARYVRVNSKVNMRIATLQLLDIDPTKTGEPDPDSPPPGPVDPSGIPVPEGFEVVGKVSIQEFEHWGRHETGYASGGSGPSERWDNTKLPSTLNILTGYEFNLGTKHGKRGDDNTDLKVRGSSHSDSNGGWYIPYIEWLVSGKPAGAGIGKEYPHPKTEHLDFNDIGKGTMVNNIKDGNWHGFMTACFNDDKGVPNIYLWYNEKATGKIDGYVLLGVSKDTGNMKPGPVLTKIGVKGSTKQQLQIRMDEVPDGKIRNAFACEIKAKNL